MSTTHTRRDFLKLTGISTGLAIGAIAATACGGGEQATPTPAPAGSGQAVTLELVTPTTDIGFDKVKLEAPAGSKITLKLANRTQNKTINLVVGKPGRMLKVVTNGQVEGETNGYVKDNDEDVIAHTGLIKPGETGEVTFDAPPAGEYQYFCTWPGYYPIMNGLLTIK